MSSFANQQICDQSFQSKESVARGWLAEQLAGFRDSYFAEESAWDYSTYQAQPDLTAMVFGRVPGHAKQQPKLHRLSVNHV